MDFSNLNITGSGILNLSNSLTFGGSGVVNFRINAMGFLNPNSFDAIFDGSAATVNFDLESNGATANSGRIISKGNTIFNIRNNTNFNTPFKIQTGSWLQF